MQTMTIRASTARAPVANRSWRKRTHRARSVPGVWSPGSTPEDPMNSAACADAGVLITDGLPGSRRHRGSHARVEYCMQQVDRQVEQYEDDGNEQHHAED